MGEQRRCFWPMATRIVKPSMAAHSLSCRSPVSRSQALLTQVRLHDLEFLRHCFNKKSQALFVVVSHLGLVVPRVASFSITKWFMFRFKNGLSQLITWERFRIKIGQHFP